MSESVILYDDDPQHREGYKVVRLDLATGKFYTQPDGPDTFTAWEIGKCSLRNNREQPIEICRRAVHFCIENPVGCYYFTTLGDREGMLSTGHNSWIPSLHSVKLPSTNSVLIQAPVAQHINLGDRLKRGCHELEFGEPLTGSWFIDLTDDDHPGLGVSTKNGLLHSNPISDEQIACLDQADAEFLNRPEERGQWYMPSIEIMRDRLWRWHRDGQPIVVLNENLEQEIGKWNGIFRPVRPRCQMPSFRIFLLHHRALSPSFGLDSRLVEHEDSLRLHLKCRTWSASIVEIDCSTLNYASSMGKLFNGFRPSDAKRNGWLRTVFTAVTLPYGSLNAWTAIMVLSQFLSLPFSCAQIRLYPLTLEPDSALPETTFIEIVRYRRRFSHDWELGNRPIVAALDSLSLDHLQRMLATVIETGTTMKQELMKYANDGDDLFRALQRGQMPDTECQE